MLKSAWISCFRQPARRIGGYSCTQSRLILCPGLFRKHRCNTADPVLLGNCNPDARTCWLWEYSWSCS